MKTKELTRTDAGNLLDAFGPCTTVYECLDARELCDEYSESSARNFREFVTTSLSAEGVRMERRIEAKNFSGEYSDDQIADLWYEKNQACAAMSRRVLAVLDEIEGAPQPHCMDCAEDLTPDSMKDHPAPADLAYDDLCAECATKRIDQ